MGGYVTALLKHELSRAKDAVERAKQAEERAKKDLERARGEVVRQAVIITELEEQLGEHAAGEVEAERRKRAASSSSGANKRPFYAAVQSGAERSKRI